MRAIIISLVSLLAGIGLGWYWTSVKLEAKQQQLDIYRGREQASANREREMQQGLDIYAGMDESDRAVAASFSLNAIQCIDSGDPQKAVQWISFPIAMYYRDYGSRAGTNAQRIKMGARIEELAQTNQIVAACIKSKTGYSEKTNAPLAFYIVSEQRIEGGRFIDTTNFPKLGYIAAKPDLMVTNLAAVLFRFNRNDTFAWVS